MPSLLTLRFLGYLLYTRSRIHILYFNYVLILRQDTQHPQFTEFVGFGPQKNPKKEMRSSLKEKQFSKQESWDSNIVLSSEPMHALSVMPF